MAGRTIEARGIQLPGKVDRMACSRAGGARPLRAGNYRRGAGFAVVVTSPYEAEVTSRREEEEMQ